MTEQPLIFENERNLRKWLAKNHSTSRGVWLCLRKKGGAVPCVSYAEALDVALCYGWIDGQKRAQDEHLFLQRFVPRGRRSIWSKVNREHVRRLIDSGQMQPAGLVEVERAQADGRWDAAYDPPSRATVPDDLQAALDENSQAKEFFVTLDRANRYAVLFRVQTAKKPETRKRKIAELVEMLSEKRKLHP